MWNEVCYILSFISQIVGWNMMLLHSRLFYVNIKKVCGVLPPYSLHVFIALPLLCVLTKVCINWKEIHLLLMNSWYFSWPYFVCVSYGKSVLCVQFSWCYKTCSKYVPFCSSESCLTPGGGHRTSEVCGWRQLRWTIFFVLMLSVFCVKGIICTVKLCKWSNLYLWLWSCEIWL
jgi:hypothetical protein